jgi:hypothetical protein
VLHRCSSCPKHSQLQSVIEELFETNNDVEDSALYKQWVCNGHTKIVSMTSTAEEFTDKFTSFIFEDVERNNSGRH